MLKTVSNTMIYIFLTLLLLSGCGLPDSATTVVAKPSIKDVIVVDNIDSVTIGFAVPYDEDISDTDIDDSTQKDPDDTPYSSIEGFEIYYKIYKSDSTEIESDEEQFNEDASGYIYETGSKKMNRLGFERLNYGPLNLEDNLSFPSFLNDYEETDKATIDVTKEFKISLQMYEAVFLVFSTDNGEIKVFDNQSDLKTVTYDFDLDGDEDDEKYRPYRNVKDSSTGYYKTFSDTVDDSDSDSNGVTSSDTQYKVSFVAFSYISSIMNELLGLNYESSIPTFLGTVDFNN